MGFEIWSGNGNIIYQNTINTNHSENGIILRYANSNIISWNIINTYGGSGVIGLV